MTESSAGTLLIPDLSNVGALVSPYRWPAGAGGQTVATYTFLDLPPSYYPAVTVTGKVDPLPTFAPFNPVQRQFTAYDGNDILYGQEGDDVLSGCEDDDQLYGGAGNDNLFGAVGNDLLDGGEGNDNLYGGFSGYLPWAGAGKDSRVFGAGLGAGYGR